MGKDSGETIQRGLGDKEVITYLAEKVILLFILLVMCAVGFYGIRLLLSHLRRRHLILPWEELDELLGPRCLEKSEDEFLESE